MLTFGNTKLFINVGHKIMKKKNNIQKNLKPM